MANAGSTDATRFGCNLDAVDATVTQLSHVNDELAHFDSRVDQYSPDLASSKMQHTLHDFYSNSFDQRKKETVSGLHDVLAGLAQGVQDIDTTLTNSLTKPASARPNTAAQRSAPVG